MSESDKTVGSVLDELELAPGGPSQQTRGKELQLMTFRLGDQLFGVDLADARVVTDMAKIAIVPGAARHVLGVMNHRGGIVPVVDLRSLVGLPTAPSRHDGKVLILGSNTSEKGVGYVIDALEDIVVTTTDQLRPQPEGLGATAARYLVATLKVGDRLVGILELRGLDGRPT